MRDEIHTFLDSAYSEKEDEVEGRREVEEGKQILGSCFLKVKEEERERWRRFLSFSFLRRSDRERSRGELALHRRWINLYL